MFVNIFGISDARASTENCELSKTYFECVIERTNISGNPMTAGSQCIPLVGGGNTDIQAFLSSIYMAYRTQVGEMIALGATPEEIAVSLGYCEPAAACTTCNVSGPTPSTISIPGGTRTTTTTTRTCAPTCVCTNCSSNIVEYSCTCDLGSAAVVNQGTSACSCNAEVAECSLITDLLTYARAHPNFSNFTAAGSLGYIQMDTTDHCMAIQNGIKYSTTFKSRYDCERIISWMDFERSIAYMYFGQISTDDAAMSTMWCPGDLPLCPPGKYRQSTQCYTCPPLSSVAASTPNIFSIIIDCYIPADVPISDATGTYSFSQDCKYTP